MKNKYIIELIGRESKTAIEVDKKLGTDEE